MIISKTSPHKTLKRYNEFRMNNTWKLRVEIVFVFVLVNFDRIQLSGLAMGYDIFKSECRKETSPNAELCTKVNTKLEAVKQQLRRVYDIVSNM